MRDYALRAGGRVGDAPQAIHLQHRARLATSRTGSPIDIDADQWLGVRVPGIVWMARGTMSLLPVSVVDAYVEGRGELSARILGTVQVAGGTGPDHAVALCVSRLGGPRVRPVAVGGVREPGIATGTAASQAIGGEPAGGRGDHDDQRDAVHDRVGRAGQRRVVQAGQDERDRQPEARHQRGDQPAEPVPVVPLPEEGEHRERGDERDGHRPDDIHFMFAGIQCYGDGGGAHGYIGEDQKNIFHAINPEKNNAAVCRQPHYFTLTGMKFNTRVWPHGSSARWAGRSRR